MSEREFPPGGRRPSSDVDEILAQIQQNLQRYRAEPIIGLVALVVALIVLWSSWFTVQPEETGVVQRLGRVVRTAEPGLHFKWPFGIDAVRLVPTARVLKEEFGFRSLATPPGQRTQYTGNQAMGNQAYKAESLMLTGTSTSSTCSGSFSTASKTRSATSLRCGIRPKPSATSPRR